MANNPTDQELKGTILGKIKEKKVTVYVVADVDGREVETEYAEDAIKLAAEAMLKKTLQHDMGEDYNSSQVDRAIELIDANHLAFSNYARSLNIAAD